MGEIDDSQDEMQRTLDLAREWILKNSLNKTVVDEMEKDIHTF